jgi:membrane-associated protease RseP (regulator of RpoE activity)
MRQSNRSHVAWWSVVVVLVAAGAVQAQQPPAGPGESPAVISKFVPVLTGAADPGGAASFTEQFAAWHNGVTINPHLYWRLGTVTYGNTLGIDIVDLDGTLRAQLGLPDDQGVVVTGVSPESPAAKAGLAPHDLLLLIDTQPVTGTKQFNEWIGSNQGKPVVFHLLRKGKPVQVAVALPQAQLYELTTTAGNRLLAGALYADADVDRKYRIGVSLSEADDVLRSQLRLAAGEGLVVTEVLDDSPAGKAGIQKHDVLIKLDGKRLTTIEAINGQIQEIKDRKVTAVLLRSGNEVSTDVTPKLTEEAWARWLVTRTLNDLVELHDAERLSGLVLRYRDGYQAIAAGNPSPAGQIAALKKQLAEIQKSLEALETALQPAPNNSPVNQNTVPEEKK